MLELYKTQVKPRDKVILCDLMQNDEGLASNNKDNNMTSLARSEKVSIIRKYHNHTLQTNQRHREEEPQNIYSNNTPVRQ